MSKTIVWGANTSWNSYFQVGANHLARLFATQGWKVAFVSGPFACSSLLNPRNFNHAMRLFRDEALFRGQWAGNLPVFSFSPLAIVRHGTRMLPESDWLLENWHRFSLPRLESVLKRQGFATPDLLVMDSPVHNVLEHVVRAKRSVVRVTDRLSGFASVTPAMLRKEKQMVANADHVLCTSRDLARTLGRDDVLYLPNGVWYDHFQPQRPLPDVLRSIPEPRAVYLGAIDHWFDMELMRRCARAHPNISFILCGPCDIMPDKPGNLHPIGLLPYNEVPALLQHCRIGLIPFAVESNRELVEDIHPLKLYEYLACGLPVVAMRWRELEAIQSPALLCGSREEFVEMVAKVLEEPPDSAAYKAFALAQDWGVRQETLKRHVGLA